MGRTVLNRELEHIQEEMLIMGSMVEEALIRSVPILQSRDAAGAQSLIDGDQQINERRFAIEAKILQLIATQQPVAGDIRVLAAVLEIITELERIGDYAKGIARISMLLGEGPLLESGNGFPTMSTKVQDMLHRALAAFIRRDVDLARQICSEDDAVDELYNRIDRDLLSCIVADPCPKTIDRASYLLWAAHNLERAADRVTNICERIVFTVTGEMKEMNVGEKGRASI